MFRLIFALLLLDFSYRSSGVPIPTNASVSLGNTLTVLAIRCENKFLSEQIKSKISYCADLSSPHGQKQLECLIFYDINKQLCAAVGDSELALTEDYSTKINEEQDVNVLCGSTKDWVFSNLTENLHYKNNVEKIFKQPVTCGKICGVEDLMSDEANFFCKYFQWGTNMLKGQGVSSTQYSAPPATSNIESKSLNPVPNDLLDVQIKNSTMPKPNVPLEEASVKNEIKAETSSENHQIIPVSAPEKSVIKANTVEAAAENPLLASDKLDDKESAVKSDSVDNTESKKGSSQKSEVDKEIQQLNSELERKEPVLDNPRDKPPSETDDYQDSDEGKEGLGDIQGDDDGDEPIVEDVNKINKVDEPKEDQSQPSQNIKTLVPGFTGDSVPGFLPSYSQEYADDDDDHFFSFFLTAVIMIILIYVLYHNKNKVGKVFFGLILEGRQSGRRRNSRGHAYRRLDTLEQAMSTNTAAPPSKIIY